jgi:hypothetical protein
MRARLRGLSIRLLGVRQLGFPHECLVHEGNVFIIERCARRRRGDLTVIVEQDRGADF